MIRKFLLCFLAGLFFSGLFGVAWAADGAGTVRFDFESGDLQGWEIIEGAFDTLLPERPDSDPKSKSSHYYLSTRGTPESSRRFKTIGIWDYNGVIESPVFVLGGGEVSFEIGGSNSEDTYLAMYSLDGRELRRANAEKSALKRVKWDVASLGGQGVYLRVVDHNRKSSGFISLDNFAVKGKIDMAATKGRQDAREKVRKAEVDRMLEDVEEIIFTIREPGRNGHWYANFGYWATDPDNTLSGDSGRLCRFNPRTGEMTILLDDPLGAVRDPQLHYDGKKLIFSYRPGDARNYNLFEMNIDGTGMRRITEGAYDDIEATYLPGGDIMFCSSRCNRWVNCMKSEVAVLYRCGPNGENMRSLSANVEHDNTPWPLPDGRILYTRWEYVDRSQVNYHHLWTSNPDGSAQMVYFGNLHPGITMIDAKPIPGTREVIASFAPQHGRNEHAGVINIINPSKGPDDKEYAKPVSPHLGFRDPYPISKDHFLVAREDQLLIMDRAGKTTVLYKLSEEDRQKGLMCHEPRPLRGRAREAQIPSNVDLSQATGELILADVNVGRNMAGVKAGEIKKLLVIESLPKPINFSGGMEPLTLGGSYTLERVLGTVPVEEDGSAYMELPALRSLFFVALDENDMSVKRMQSFLTVQPGEVTSCVGCHEQRTRAPQPIAASALMATQRGPSKIEAIAGVPDVFEFPRDIQPILDKHCVSCHDYDATEKGGPMAGGVILSGDRGPTYSHSYFTISARRLVADGRNLPVSNYAPRALGSSGSRLMKLIDGSHYDARPSQHERKLVRLWIESAAVYPGTYAALGSGMIAKIHGPAGPDARIERADKKWASTKAAIRVQEQRCNACHTKELRLPSSASDSMGVKPGRMQEADKARRVSPHILYNLTRPEKSLLLLAPLAKEAGGYGICGSDGGQEPVFLSAKDKDYQTLLTSVRETKALLDEIKRFDMAGFRPNEHYLREMKRYGALLDDADVDYYATDQAYWESFWHKPVR